MTEEEFNALSDEEVKQAWLVFNAGSSRDGLRICYSRRDSTTGNVNTESRHMDEDPDFRESVKGRIVDGRGDLKIEEAKP